MSRGFLLDTNIISELVKAKPSPSVTKWINSTDESLLYLSVLTLGEIRKGITSLPDATRRVALEAWLDHDLVLRFSGRVLSIDHPVADRWGRIAGSVAALKSPLPVIDGLLAATALHHELIFVTRDTTHVAVSGVSAFNPWTT
ncbi:MAG TPA: type II toxin-antitoxin system VapC family toxin [Terriglobales bacterium]|nr:type II toxin-antitoxin system VapC family toxin [Terriglobales bacterium]